MSERNESGSLRFSLGVWIFLVCFFATIGGLLFEYSFEYWAAFVKGHAVDLPFWVAIIGGLLLNGLNLPIALFTFIFSCAT